MFALRLLGTASAILIILAPNLPAQSYMDKLSKRFNREISVQLYDGLEGKIGVRGEAVIECYRGAKLSEIFYYSTEIEFRYRNNGIEIRDESDVLAYGLAEVRIKPRYGSSFVTFNGRAYRGYIKCKYQDSPKEAVVLNVVDIEDYLRGVLPAEIGDRTPDEYEAIKAQAIAARTYAVWRLTDRGTGGNLSPTVSDQVYNGLDSEKEFLSRGIEETRGVIMTFSSGAGGQERPIAAFYHAVCGGHTASVEKIWPERKPAPYLVGVNDDDFCSWAKSYSWIENYSAASLRELFSKYFGGKGSGNHDIGVIEDVRFSTDHGSGRIEMMEITTDTGIYRETCDKIRWAMMRQSAPGSILPSTKFSAEKLSSEGKFAGLKLTGFGNGHGVGMCQCGAIGRSRAGQSYDAILRHYYGPIKLAKLY